MSETVSKKSPTLAGSIPNYVNMKTKTIRIRALAMNRIPDGAMERREGDTTRMEQFEIVLPARNLEPEEIEFLDHLFPVCIEEVYRILDKEALLASIIHE